MTYSRRVPVLGCVHIGNLVKMRSFYSLAFNKQLTIMIRKARLQKCTYITTLLELFFVLGIAILVIQQNFLFSRLFKVSRLTSRFFHSYKNVTITGEGLQILTYARHLWPLRRRFTACHTYNGTWHPFILAIHGPVTLTPIAERLAVELSLPVLTT